MTKRSPLIMDVPLLRIFLVCFCVALVSGGVRNPNGVVLRFFNNLTEPHMDFSIDLVTDKARTILELMEHSAWQDSTLKFSMEFHASSPSYMLNAVRKDEIHANGTYIRKQFVFHDVEWAGDKTYWSIRVGDTAIPVGIDTYMPKKGDIVTFELVSYA